MDLTKDKGHEVDENFPLIPPVNSVDCDRGICLEKYRWFNLILFCLCSAVNALQCLQYSVIADTMGRYYNVTSYTASATAEIYILGCILLFLPAAYVMEKMSLRLIVITSSLMTAIGVTIKLFSVSPNKFYVVLLGQFVCGVGEVLIMSTPAKLATVWFGTNEVSTACSVALLGNKLGSALQSVLSPYLVRDSSNLEDIGRDLFKMFIYTDLAAFIIFGLITIFFREKPKHLPSYSEGEVQHRLNTANYFESMNKLLTNRDYVYLLVSFGIVNGLWNAFIILIDTVYLLFHPENREDVGLLELISIVSGGCFGCVAFGYILDKTQKYKNTSIAVMIIASLLFLNFTVFLMQKNRILIFLSATAVGFFLGGQLGIAFPYTLEVTYPESEITACAVLNAVLLSFDILAAAVYSVLLTTVGGLWSNVMVSVIISLCALLVFKMSTHLRRKETNLARKHLKSVDTRNDN